MDFVVWWGFVGIISLVCILFIDFIYYDEPLNTRDMRLLILSIISGPIFIILLLFVILKIYDDMGEQRKL
jgi:hypothetical protein